MAGTLEDLKKRLSGSKTFNRKMLADLDYDAVLDGRDSPPFDSEWVRVDKVVRSTQKDSRLSDEQWELIDEIRHIAFTQTAKFAGQHEICSYVSDDFGLIATALALGHDDNWLTALWSSYKNCTIPSGELEPIEGGLGNHI
jgi:hypothetical protein